MKKLTLLVITALLTIVLLTAGCTEDDNGDGEEEEQLETAPTFSLESTDNNTIRLSSYQGKVVVLDFMFINCGPCQEEMGELVKVYNNYDDNEVVIISIDTQTETETEDQLRTYKATEGYEWNFCMDTKSVGEDDYGTSSYPTLFIINKEGKIAYDHVGISEYSTLSSEIDKLL